MTAPVVPIKIGAAHYAELEVAGAAVRGWLPTPDLAASDFLNPVACAVYLAAIALRESGGMGCVSINPLADELQRTGHFAAVGGISGLSQLEDSAGTEETLGIAADRVRREAVRRRAGEDIDRIRRLGLDDDEAASRLRAVADRLERAPGVGRVETYAEPLISFLGTDEPEEDTEAWLVNGIIPAGSPFAIAGPPKAAKTWAASDLAICIVANLAWLGVFAVRQMKVLLILREDTVREVRRRIWRLCRGHGIDPRSLDGWLAISVAQPFYFDRPEDLARMRRTLETFQPGCVIVDSLSRCHTADENDRSDMAKVTAAWSDMSAEYGIAIGCVHHFNKSPGQGEPRSPGLRMRGTGDLFALVRHVVAVEPVTKHKGMSKVETDGNLPGQPDPFAFSLEDGVNDRGQAIVQLIHRGEVAGLGDQEVDAKILKVLSGGSLGARELRQAVGCKSETLGRRCFDLQRRGLIDRSSDREPWHLKGGSYAL